MKIALYTQNTVRAGEICRDEELIDRGSDDIFFWEGTETELLELAEKILVSPAVSIYQWRCARSVVHELGRRSGTEAA